jgi:hypothetical protein
MPLCKTFFMSSRKHLAPNNTKHHCKHFWSVLIEYRLQDCFPRPHYSFKCFFSSRILLSNDNHLHFQGPCSSWCLNHEFVSSLLSLFSGLRGSLQLLVFHMATLTNRGKSRIGLNPWKQPSLGFIQSDVQSRMCRIVTEGKYSKTVLGILVHHFLNNIFNVNIMALWILI